MSRLFKTGEWVFVNADVVNAKGETIIPKGGEARVMVFDPSKGETPFGLRTPTGFITQVYVNEAILVKNPARARETPTGA